MVKLETTTAYTVEEVAEMLHKHKTTVLRYIHNGDLRAQKVGGSYYITERELLDAFAGIKLMR